MGKANSTEDPQPPATGRKSEISSAVKTILDALESWEHSEIDYFPASLEMAISAGLNVVLNGDVPAECLPLFQKVVLLGDVWTRLVDGEDGLLLESGMPARPFWDAVSNIRKLSEREEIRERQGIEPVSELLAQMKDNPRKYEQIARMYGRYDSRLDRYVGPFFFAGGSPNVDLIEKEGRKRGSVVPINYNPLAEQQQETRKQSLTALDKVRAKLAEQSGQPIDKEPQTSIESFLREGQFPDVIAAVKGVSEDSVREKAVELGIAIRERNDILNEAYQESMRTDNAFDDVYRGGSSDVRSSDDGSASESDSEHGESDSSSGNDDDSDSESSEETLSSEDLATEIELMLEENPEVTTSDVHSKLAENGQTASKIAIGRQLAAMKRSFASS